MEDALVVRLLVVKERTLPALAAASRGVPEGAARVEQLHRCVNVFDNEMRDLAGAERVSYNGKKYELDKDDYFERPWEIEAHGRELGLFVRWAEANQLGHLKWTQENERG